MEDDSQEPPYAQVQEGTNDSSSIQSGVSPSDQEDFVDYATEEVDTEANKQASSENDDVLMFDHNEATRK